MSRRTIMHVIPGIHDEASGPTYSVMRLCESQADQGANVELHVVRSAGQRGKGFVIIEHATESYAGRFRVSSSLKRTLVADYGQPRIVHSHSLWEMPNIYGRGIPRGSVLVASPRGTMSDWAWKRSYWVKRVAWFVGQKKMLERCDCFHATAAHEFLDIRRRGFRQPVAVIPNGIDVPELRRREPRSSGQRVLLFLARLHPVKGLADLIRSWNAIRTTAPRLGASDSGLR